SVKDDELIEDYIIPSIFNKKVVVAVAHEVAETAKRTGIARK
ncbi:MAG: NAD-dependent malic enzyme, partial [Nitrospirota bacterium]|nr:NAD-dependent malic enzyme [Nitrospirota bacterium]